MRTLGTILALLALAGAAGAMSSPEGPVTDHLECYRVRDPQHRATYTADLDGLAVPPAASSSCRRS